MALKFGTDGGALVSSRGRPSSRTIRRPSVIRALWVAEYSQETRV